MLRLEGRRGGVWPGPEPSLLTAVNDSSGASIPAQPVTVPPLPVEPALVSAFILQSPPHPSQVWVYARRSVIWVSWGRDHWSRRGQKPDTHTSHTGNQGHSLPYREMRGSLCKKWRAPSPCVLPNPIVCRGTRIYVSNEGEGGGWGRGTVFRACALQAAGSVGTRR